MAPKRTINTISEDVEEPYPPPEVPAQVNGRQILEELANNLDIYTRLTEQFRNNALELWMETLTEEINKRHAIEASLKQKEKQLIRFREMYNFYMGRTTMLEDIVQRKLATAGVISGTAASSSGGQEEEVASSSEPVSGISVDVKCKNCRTRPANMLWFPCRHLCVCLACDQKVKVCPMCSAPKISAFMINLPYRS